MRRSAIAIFMALITTFTSLPTEGFEAMAGFESVNSVYEMPESDVSSNSNDVSGGSYVSDISYGETDLFADTDELSVSYNDLIETTFAEPYAGDPVEGDKFDLYIDDVKVATYKDLYNTHLAYTRFAEKYEYKNSNFKIVPTDKAAFDGEQICSLPKVEGTGLVLDISKKALTDKENEPQDYVIDADIVCTDVNSSYNYGYFIFRNAASTITFNGDFIIDGIELNSNAPITINGNISRSTTSRTSDIRVNIDLYKDIDSPSGAYYPVVYNGKNTNSSVKFHLLAAEGKAIRNFETDDGTQSVFPKDATVIKSKYYELKSNNVDKLCYRQDFSFAKKDGYFTATAVESNPIRIYKNGTYVGGTEFIHRAISYITSDKYGTKEDSYEIIPDEEVMLTTLYIKDLSKWPDAADYDITLVAGNEASIYSNFTVHMVSDSLTFPLSFKAVGNCSSVYMYDDGYHNSISFERNFIADTCTDFYSDIDSITIKGKTEITSESVYIESFGSLEFEGEFIFSPDLRPVINSEKKITFNNITVDSLERTYSKEYSMGGPFLRLIQGRSYNYSTPGVFEFKGSITGINGALVENSIGICREVISGEEGYRDDSYYKAGQFCPGKLSKGYVLATVKEDSEDYDIYAEAIAGISDCYWQTQYFGSYAVGYNDLPAERDGKNIVLTADGPELTQLPDIFTFDSSNHITGLTDYGKTLKEIVIDTGSVKYINEYAFKDAVNLEKVVFTSKKSDVNFGMGCFMGSGLKSIIIPDGTKYITSKIFSGCTNLEYISFPATIWTIADDAFEGVDKSKLKVDYVKGSDIEERLVELGLIKGVAKSYKITYELNGGINNSENPSKYYTDTVVEFMAPTKSGYSFAGWYLDSKFKTLIETTEGLNKDIKLYAKWEEIKYTIRYDANYPEGAKAKTDIVMDEVKASYNKAVKIAASKYSCYKYKFTGWNTSPDGSGTSFSAGSSKKLDSYISDDTVVLYAQWKAGTYTVKYDSNASSTTTGKSSGKMSSTTMTFGNEDNKSTALKYTVKGYKFTGWNTRADGLGISFESTDGIVKIGTALEEIYALDSGKTVILYAMWQADSGRVIFKDSDGSDVEILEGNDNSLLPMNVAISKILPKFVKEEQGYKIAGFSTSIGGKTKYKTSSKPNLKGGEELTLYIKWSEVSYKISYDLKGGKSTKASKKNPTKYTVSKGVINLAEPQKTGYVFAGWVDEEGNVCEFVDSASLHRNIKYTATWTPITYRVTFMPDDEKGVVITDTDKATVVLDYSQKVDFKVLTEACTQISDEAPSNAVKGWSSTKGGKAKYTLTKEYSALTSEAGKEIVLYPVTGNRVYNITYNLGDNADYPAVNKNPVRYEYSKSKAVSIKNPTRKGYVFKGWSLTEGDTEAYNTSKKQIVKGASGDITLSAEWKSVGYIVKLNKNNSKVSYKEGAQTVYGARDALIYYDTDGSFNNSAIFDENPYYVISGWNTKANGKGTKVFFDEYGEVGLEKLSTKDGATVTLYAQWTPATYDVRYVNVDPLMDNGGDIVELEVNNKNATTISCTKKVKLSKPTKYGFVFKGWYKEYNPETKEFTGKVSQLDAYENAKGETTTLYGKWELK